MKQKLILSLLAVTLIQSAYALDADLNQSHMGTPKNIPQLTPQQSQEVVNQLKNMKPEQYQAIAKSLDLTPQQSQELLKQVKDLNPDQLQAIAKNYQQQINNTNPQHASAMGTETTTHTISQSSQTNLEKASFKAVMAKEHNKSIEELKRDQAFSQTMQEVMPLSPDQIMKMHKFYDMTLQAKATPPSPSPTPNFVSYPVHLEPGSLPPIIRLAAGFVSTLLFIDSSGAPWPLTAYSIGDPASFNIQWDQKGHTLFVQSLKPYANGNLAVRLWGLNTPVMLTLVSGQRNVDFRVDLQVPGHGPEARPPVLDTTFNAKVNPVLINILDGVPPRGSIKLEVTGGQGDAWLADNRIYFRTKLTVLSPAWVATVASPDGTHVYEMVLTPYILASQNGKTIDIKLSGL